MKQLYPHIGLALFTGVTYLALLSGVPAQNMIPATFGVGSFIAMTACMVLAARIAAVDELCGGPGRSYQLHRVMAHWAWILMLAHWILAQPRGLGLFPGWEWLGTSTGTFAGIYLLILVFYGMIPAIPYHIWRWTHFAMSPIYVITVMHVFLTAIPVVPFSLHWWSLVAVSVIGLVAMVRVLVHHFHRPRRMSVVALRRLSDAIDVRLAPADGRGPVEWTPGQHASFACTKRGLREPHPFTIASAPEQGMVRFLIFDRGDYTHRLQSDLQVGDQVLLSRVAGDFAPQYQVDRPYRQIWVAGGAGLTPFLAAIGAMKPDNGPRIDLFYSYRSLDQAVDVAYLVSMAKKLPQLGVHLLGDAEGARFNIQTFDAHLPPGWQSSELYACGPDPLLTLASCAYRAAGGQLPIHTEVFDFRNPVRTWRQALGIGPKRIIQQKAPSAKGQAIGPQVVGVYNQATPAWPHRFNPGQPAE
ncbi:hypothetical protein [Roseibium sp. RKSG952]|uniref:hypothetical protein n=1 Tax=Roseibium sp. RKSG952 TaxID=2529384 RepID=UPI0012BBF3FE|nr:hypothetical protein [Roseibium sp. RKSG952]MTI00196.1 hypothetical protein [Roseibium sp. RKSG952]